MPRRGWKSAIKGFVGKKRPGRPGAIARLASLDIKMLQAALDQKLSQLAEEKAQLLARVGEIDRLMGGGPAAAPVVKRRKRKTGRPIGRPRKVVVAEPAGGLTLGGKLVELLGAQSKPMKVQDLVEAVKQSGYPSRSPHLRSMVNQVLSNDKRFRRVRRGLYKVR